MKPSEFLKSKPSGIMGISLAFAKQASEFDEKPHGLDPERGGFTGDGCLCGPPFKKRQANLILIRFESHCQHTYCISNPLEVGGTWPVCLVVSSCRVRNRCSSWDSILVGSLKEQWIFRFGLEAYGYGSKRKPLGTAGFGRFFLYQLFFFFFLYPFFDP